MVAQFYAEDLGIALDLAARVAGFMEIAQASPAIERASPWAKHGKVRVYFEPWSQNRRGVYHLADTWYYDAIENEVYATGFFYNCKHIYMLSQLVQYSASNFAGAKTKQRLKEFSEVFYGQKASWG